MSVMIAAFMRGVTRLNDVIGRGIALIVFAMFAFLIMNALNTPIGILRETVRSKAKPGLKSGPGRFQASGVYR